MRAVFARIVFTAEKRGKPAFGNYKIGSVQKEIRSVISILLLLAYAFIIGKIGFLIATSVLVTAILIFTARASGTIMQSRLQRFLSCILFFGYASCFAAGAGRFKMNVVLQGLHLMLSWQNLLIIFVGLVLGIVVGAIPGLTSDLGIILCIPLTYGMEPVMAILMLLAIYCGGTYGGSITAILINTPGTSANAATLFDGYPMTQKGEAYKALSMAIYASTIGGLISAFVLLFAAPQIAKVTLLFGPAEYLSLAVFGLSVIAGVSNKSIFKGLIGACIGIFVSTMGMDNISGTQRFTFDNINLLRGVDLIIALIGLLRFRKY